MLTWRYIQWFCQDRDDNSQVIFNTIKAQTQQQFPNANNITANSLVDFWYEKLCGVVPDAHSQDRMAHFMSLTHLDEGNPTASRNEPIDLNNNGWPIYNEEKLYALVSMICMTSEFSYR